MAKYSDKFTFGVWGERPQLWKVVCHRKKDFHRLPSDKWYRDVFKPPEFDLFGEGLPNRLNCENISNLTDVFNYEMRGFKYKIPF